MDFPVVPKRIALVNVDLQNCFVDGPLAPANGIAVVEQVNRLATVCRSAGILVVHTSHVFRPDGSNSGVLKEIAPAVFDNKWLDRGQPLAALHPALHVDPRDILLEKPRFGAFYNTDLESVLRGRGVDTIIISGIATNVCCETTAREAMVRDFRVFFLSDGTSGSALPGASAADIQKVTLATLGFVFAQVLTVDEMISKIESAASAAAGYSWRKPRRPTRACS
jgi:ureidoacrylate peracid hydrolase